MHIAIVFSTDINNWLPVRVCMESVMSNINKNVEVLFYVLHDNSADDIKKKTISNIQDFYSNCKIKFINANDDFIGAYAPELEENIPSNSTYFRLKIPSYLADEDKCLYLDTDTIVCSDISLLFEKDFYISIFMGSKMYFLMPDIKIMTNL